MVKKHTKHLPHYLPFIGMLTASVLAFLFFSYDKQFQIGVALSIAVGHVTWGIIHHLIHKDLCLEVLLEYIMVAVLGSVVLITMILRG